MTTNKTSYKILSAELDQIVQQLESTELDIDEGLKLYERGMEIVQLLERYLKTAENKVSKIKAKWAEPPKP